MVVGTDQQEEGKREGYKKKEGAMGWGLGGGGLEEVGEVQEQAKERGL